MRRPRAAATAHYLRRRAKPLRRSPPNSVAILKIGMIRRGLSDGWLSRPTEVQCRPSRSRRQKSSAGHMHQVRAVHQPGDYDCVASGIKSKRHVISLARSLCSEAESCALLQPRTAGRARSEQFRPAFAFLMRACRRPVARPGNLQALVLGSADFGGSSMTTKKLRARRLEAALYTFCVRCTWRTPFHALAGPAPCGSGGAHLRLPPQTR